MSDLPILPAGVVLSPFSGEAAGAAGSAESSMPEQATTPPALAIRRPLGEPGRAAGSRRKGRRASPGRFAVLNDFVDLTMRKISPNATKAWFVLYRDTKPNGVAKTGLTDLANRAGCSLSTAKRALKELKNRGLVTVARRGGPLSGPNSYKLSAIESPARGARRA